LAFKPRTDDMREAPSRVLMEALWAAGAAVRAYDPVAMKETAHLYPAEVESGRLVLAKSPEDAATGADALALVTEWRIFQSPNFEKLKTLLKAPVIVDGRNQYDPAFLKASGYAHYAIGRAALNG
jgi:UDPglucose 6-dehydrogenase